MTDPFGRGIQCSIQMSSAASCQKDPPEKKLFTSSLHKLRTYK